MAFAGTQMVPLAAGKFELAITASTVGVLILLSCPMWGSQLGHNQLNTSHKNAEQVLISCEGCLTPASLPMPRFKTLRNRWPYPHSRLPWLVVLPTTEQQGC
ncbi:MAG: hypothetical protein CM15mP68_0060 [Pseudomonadota bacterium]|nr:MAG: hypothetical protein CM15mP68_0060 [Pseudomonadota bacterium]